MPVLVMTILKRHRPLIECRNYEFFAAASSPIAFTNLSRSAMGV